MPPLTVLPEFPGSWSPGWSAIWYQPTHSLYPGGWHPEPLAWPASEGLSAAWPDRI